jgi:hypothetical protein
MNKANTTKITNKTFKTNKHDRRYEHTLQNEQTR